MPLVVVGGKEYGTGSSRDWAAKGTLLLGVQGGDRRELRAHPPLQPGRHGRAAAAVQGRHDAARRLKLDGTERFDIAGVGAGFKPRGDLACRIHRADGKVETMPLLCRIDTLDELEYFRHGGILPYVLRHMMKAG